MTIYAAGCVVYRRNASGVELLIIHRDRYDDWSFPKGKRDKGETDLECAAREVREETGFTGEFGRELSPTEYVVEPSKAKKSKGVESERKVVRWWLMKQTAGEFEPNDEVDSVRWVAQDVANNLLTYGRDRAILKEFDVTELA